MSARTPRLSRRDREWTGCALRGPGGVADHVHLLVSLKPTSCLSDFMRELKKSSSNWLRESKCPGFHWQEGYAAFTVSASARASVRAYIANQEEHHRVKSFREELIDFLKKIRSHLRSAISRLIPPPMASLRDASRVWPLTRQTTRGEFFQSSQSFEFAGLVSSY